MSLLLRTTGTTDGDQTGRAFPHEDGEARKTPTMQEILQERLDRERLADRMRRAPLSAR